MPVPLKNIKFEKITGEYAELKFSKPFYFCASEGIDTIGDYYIIASASGLIAKYCTVGNSTKGLGTWVIYNITDTTGNLVLPKTTNTGIKLDTTTPTFGYKDLIGQINPHVGGGIAPTSTLIKGTGTHMRSWAFSAGDVIDSVIFHIPHDYLPGSDIFLHCHYKHAGTAISGNLVLDWYVNYCKGYTQAGQIFGNEINITQTISTPNIATIPRYSHNIAEFQLSNNGGNTTHLDRNLIEVDGIINVSITATTIPTITGAPTGSANEPFIFMIDIHYQTTGVIGTKDKNFPFYT